MNLKLQALIDQYKTAIYELEQENVNDFKIVEQGIQLSRKYLQDLRILVRNNEFSNEEDEVDFFKTTKPFINSRLKFYTKLYKYLLEKPAGSIKLQRNFIDKQIKVTQEVAVKNLDFITYYREQATHLDKYYFLRGKDKMSLVSDNSYFYTDAEFSTSHDNMVAKVMAYDLLTNFYQQELKELRFIEKEGRSNISRPKLNLHWTGNKTDLVELIYALHSSDCVNHGKADIKEIAQMTERIFKVELGDYYRTYLSLRIRKKGRTKFLDALKNSLEKRMEESDE